MRPRWVDERTGQVDRDGGGRRGRVLGPGSSLGGRQVGCWWSKVGIGDSTVSLAAASCCSPSIPLSLSLSCSCFRPVSLGLARRQQKVEARGQREWWPNCSYPSPFWWDGNTNSPTYLSSAMLASRKFACPRTVCAGLASAAVCTVWRGGPRLPAQSVLLSTARHWPVGGGSALVARRCSRRCRRLMSNPDDVRPRLAWLAFVEPRGVEARLWLFVPSRALSRLCFGVCRPRRREHGPRTTNTLRSSIYTIESSGSNYVQSRSTTVWREMARGMRRGYVCKCRREKNR